jgi:hypothetical protein
MDASDSHKCLQKFEFLIQNEIRKNTETETEINR